MSAEPAGGGKGADVIVDGNGGPMFSQNALAKWLTLYKLHGFNAARPASGKTEATNTAKRINHFKHQLLPFVIRDRQTWAAQPGL